MIDRMGGGCVVRVFAVVTRADIKHRSHRKQPIS
jgi:hypothetical protein